MEISEDTIRPGDVYEYSCGNNQGYGYMVPVKTSKGWDFIDTYQLGIPWHKDGETSDDASIRRIIELGYGEHDRYVSEATSSFYYHNVHFGRVEVPYGLRLAFNLNDYNVTPRRECEDYDDRYVVYNVPLYREQHYNWNSGMALGLCFVRKDAKKSPVKEFRSLLKEASGSINEPYAGSAVYLLSRVEEKLRELEDLGLSTPMDEDDFSYLAKRIEIIDKCSKDLRKVRTERTERIARLCVSDSTGEEK